MTTCNLRHHSEHRFCCAGCGRAFSSMSAFDGHRVTLETGRRGCVDPGSVLRKGQPRFVPREMSGKSGNVMVWGLPAAEETNWRTA